MLSAAAVSWKHLDRQPRGCPLIHPADDEEPHTTQPDEEKQTPSNEDGRECSKEGKHFHRLEEGLDQS